MSERCFFWNTVRNLNWFSKWSLLVSLLDVFLTFACLIVPLRYLHQSQIYHTNCTRTCFRSFYWTINTAFFSRLTSFVYLFFFVGTTLKDDTLLVSILLWSNETVFFKYFLSKIRQTRAQPTPTTTNTQLNQFIVLWY